MQSAVADLVTLGAELHEVHAHLRADEHEGEADLGSVADEGESAVLDLLALGEVLKHGHEVAHLLSGVVELRHAVDDGHSGASGEADDVLVTVNASHHDVEEVAHDASSVAQGLVATELNGARTIELSVATEVAHGGLEGKTGTSGDLLEDHAKALVTEQVRIETVNLDGLLHCQAKILDSENLLFGEVISVEKILGQRHCDSFPSAAPTFLVDTIYFASALSLIP